VVESAKPVRSSLAQLVTFADVRLLECSARTSIDHPHLSSGASELSVSIGSGVRHRAEDAFSIVALVETEVNAKTPDGEKPREAAVTIKVVFELGFKLDSAELVRTTDEELASFAESTGIFLAWPYARHLVQDLSGQMRLPPIILPVMTANAETPGAPSPKRPTAKRK
jgi:preprotein translocase subunit SecB